MTDGTTSAHKPIASKMRNSELRVQKQIDDVSFNWSEDSNIDKGQFVLRDFATRSGHEAHAQTGTAARDAIKITEPFVVHDQKW